MLYNKPTFICCIFVFISIIYGLPQPTANAALTKAQTMRPPLTKRGCDVSSGEFVCGDAAGEIHTYLCCKADEQCKTSKRGEHFCGIYDM